MIVKKRRIFKAYVMLDFQKAPYIELEHYKAPKGLESYFIPMEDGKKIRLMCWSPNLPKDQIKGTFLLQQGHNEFIEKYYETIQEILDRGFYVVCYDWRGQGMSDRMIKNINKQFIRDFSIHISDLSFILNEIINKNFPKPLFGFGHSMGGYILLIAQKKFQKYFKGLILSAPMLGFKIEYLLFPVVTLTNFFSSEERYFIGSKPSMGKETPFKDNDLTSDQRRYQRTQELVRKNPKLRLWGVTNAWVKAVKDSYNITRKKSWLGEIKTKIIIFNPIEDKVVDSQKTKKINKLLPNSQIINLKNIKHEILMEKNEHRANFWESVDNFLDNLSLN
tara:strand:+ start:3867 stop:4868 length:1002 start_codon:yes stop_codon:yes gene_type:complete